MHSTVVNAAILCVLLSSGQNSSCVTEPVSDVESARETTPAVFQSYPESQVHEFLAEGRVEVSWLRRNRLNSLKKMKYLFESMRRGLPGCRLNRPISHMYPEIELSLIARRMPCCPSCIVTTEAPTSK